jgi:SLT domain-containing protein
MKVLKLAAGFAVGYVVGSRAGREKYEQIAAYARRTSSHPTVVQAQEKAKSLLANGTQAAVAKLPHDDTATTGPSAGSTRTTSPVRQSTAARTTPSTVGGDPLA